MLLKNSISHTTINDNTPKIIRNEGSKMQGVDSLMQVNDTDEQQPPTVGNRQINQTPFMSDKQGKLPGAMTL